MAHLAQGFCGEMSGEPREFASAPRTKLRAQLVNGPDQFFFVGALEVKKRRTKIDVAGAKTGRSCPRGDAFGRTLVPMLLYGECGYEDEPRFCSLLSVQHRL